MNTQIARMNVSRPAQPTRAFTLIEMLTVIAILAIVIGIILPIMAGARTAAKKSDTRVLLSNLAQAAAAFQNEQRRLPGYFSPRQMGDTQNGGRGLTTMDNMLIDLLGGITTQGANGTTILSIGPTMTNLVTIDLAAMGTTKQNSNGSIGKSYLTMDAKRFVPQDGAAGGTRAVGSLPELAYFPTLIDSFGSPILAWVGDEVPSAGTFAAIDSSMSARYWQVQNAGFLNSKSLGKIKEDQTDTMRGSALSSSVVAINLSRTMEALLGNASQPDPAAPAGTPKPLAPRAPIVFQSAGPDGIYVGLRDKGARAGFVPYAVNQDPFGGTLFDDMIGTAGN